MSILDFFCSPLVLISFTFDVISSLGYLLLVYPLEFSQFGSCFDLQYLIIYPSPLQTWKSLPDSNEVSKDFPALVMNSVETTLDRLAASNMFFIAKRKHANQDVLYLSAKIPRGTPFLIEITAAIGIPGIKCAIKTPSPEMAPLFFEGIEALLS